MMDSDFQSAEKYLRSHNRKKAWHRVAMCLACVVVFCTTYALILPAITLEGPGCGLSEHAHSEECYTWVTSLEKTVLACDGETLDLHHHTPDCYAEDGSLICGYADFVVHSHNDRCCDENGALWCTLPEISAHTHSDGCYTLPVEEPHSHGEDCFTRERGELTCTEHVHEDACFAETSVLICTLEEQDGHQHGEECRDEAGEIVCGQEASEGHHHGDGCYEIRQEQICGVDSDHQHGDECYVWVETLICDLSTEISETDPEPVLTCGKAEIILHEHTQDCLDESGSLICGMVEVLVHVHDENCFRAEERQVLTCTLEEHTHNDTCQAQKEESTYSCGKEVHTHGETCYDEEGTLICEQEEHTHDETCQVAEEESAYSCGKEVHTHGETCYDEAGTLTCEQEEHTHTDDCQVPPETEPEYECGKEPHTHGDDCYDEEGNLTCTQEEHVHTDDCLPKTYYCGWVAHVHDESCLDEAGERVCGQEEHTHTDRCLLPIPYCGKEEHTHGEGCFDEEGTLICLLEEHSHTMECFLPTLLTEAEREELLKELTQAVEELEALEGLTDEDITAAQELLTRLEEAYRQRWLEDDVFLDLYNRVDALLLEAYDSIAEPCYGNNWRVLRDSGWFYEYSGLSVAAYSADGFAPYAALDGDTSPSSVQVNEPGGTNSADEVTVSKTIAGTDIENVFDITLTVQTPQNIGEIIKEPDMAVVIVMDISHTMNSDFTNFNGVTRYAAAMEAAEDFLDKFADNNSLGVSKIGYVAFNTDAHQIFGLQACTNEAQATALKNTMRTATGSIINANDYSVAHSRFTNIEAGLKMARDMLNGVSNKNKFIIFLSDGFPTTYIESGYAGYDTYDTTGEHFYDAVLQKRCLYGTSYSDRAAIKARKMATSIKDTGTTIFSIGVDVTGQKIQEYIDDSEKANGFSVVDRSGTQYEIGDASDQDAFKKWLGNSIGSGYYYDSTNTDGLKAAYTDIFEKIKTTVAQNTAADWVASDPIPSYTPDEIDFIGLYDIYNVLQDDSLTGSYTQGGENTAEYKLVNEDDKNQAIQWDLKQSGYTVTKVGGKDWYSYQLKYRVRLKNEDVGFAENKIYNTNGTTTLQYRVIRTVDGSTVLSTSATIDFPIPSVHGYLGELAFQKVDNYGRMVAGAEFTLSHSTECKICRGNGTQVTIADRKATSGEDGQVSFTGIPSGHVYTLEETKVPEDYSTGGYQYTVTVAYDRVSVTMTDSEGKKTPWDGETPENWRLLNYTYYELPNTGGMGTTSFYLPGTLLALTGGVLLLTGKRKRREN